MRNLGVPLARRLAQKNRSPAFRALDNKGGIMMSHREFVGYIGQTEGANGIFQAIKHAINPAIKSSFPYLSRIARNFEKYAMHELAYNICPVVAATVTGTTHVLGDPSPADAAPTSLVEGMALPVVKRGQAWQKYVANLRPFTKVFNIIKGRATTHKYVRSEAVREQESINDSDMGNVYFGTNGVAFPAGVNHRFDTELIGGGVGEPVAEVWVDYKCELVSPSLSADGGEAKGDWKRLQYDTTAGAFPSNNHIFNSDNKVLDDGTLGVTAGTPDVGKLIFPERGNYLVFVHFLVSGTPTTSVSLSNMSASGDYVLSYDNMDNGVTVQHYGGALFADTGYDISSTALSGSLSFMVEITDPAEPEPPAQDIGLIIRPYVTNYPLFAVGTVLEQVSVMVTKLHPAIPEPSKEEEKNDYILPSKAGICQQHLAARPFPSLPHHRPPAARAPASAGDYSYPHSEAMRVQENLERKLLVALAERDQAERLLKEKEAERKEAQDKEAYLVVSTPTPTTPSPGQ